MSRARGVLCRACLALAAVLAVLLLLPLPLPRAPAPDPGRIPTPGLTLEVSRLQPDDVFIAVKTTRKNHGPRLRLLLRTWISRAPRQTFIFTDGNDPELQLLAGGRMINTNCSAVRTRQALCCKMSVEYDKFMESGRKWFCHVDDDNYVNPESLLHLLSTFSSNQDVYLGRPSLDHPIEATERVQGGGTSNTVKFWFATGGAGFCLSRGLALKMSPWASLGSFMSTAERVRLPDDCTVGYIVEGLLGARLLHSPLFHSHLENLQRLPSDAVLQQVTLSYGGPENPRNVVNIAGSFSIQQDPTRFQSVHCLLYPDTHWCPVKNRGEVDTRYLGKVRTAGLSMRKFIQRQQERQCCGTIDPQPSPKGFPLVRSTNPVTVAQEGTGSQPPTAAACPPQQKMVPDGLVIKGWAPGLATDSSWRARRATVKTQNVQTTWPVDT